MTPRALAQQALREPLVHFLLGGLAIFAFFAWRGEPADPASRVIDVDRETQAQIALTFERTMQRPPTDQELDGLIEQYVREEVLYREALRLGLDADDPVVRRRLAKKMDFLATSSAETAQPSEAELQAWYAAHPTRFAEDARLSFDQVYFRQRPDAAVRAELAGDWRKVGEPVSLPASVEDRAREAVVAQFGPEFADTLLEMEPGDEWQGPIRSGVGWHFVRLRKAVAGTLPPLEAKRDHVIEDWRRETAQQREEEAYQLLRDAYTVTISR